MRWTIYTVGVLTILVALFLDQMSSARGYGSLLLAVLVLDLFAMALFTYLALSDRSWRLRILLPVFIGVYMFVDIGLRFFS